MTKARDMRLNGSFTRGREKQETKSPFTIPEFAPIVVDHLVSRKTIQLATSGDLRDFDPDRKFDGAIARANGARADITAEVMEYIFKNSGLHSRLSQAGLIQGPGLKRQCFDVPNAEGWAVQLRNHLSIALQKPSTAPVFGKR